MLQLDVQYLEGEGEVEGGGGGGGLGWLPAAVAPL